MPGTLRVYEPNNKILNAAGDKERADRAQMIRKMQQWRDGEHPNTLKVYAGERSDNVKLNLIGQMVDDLVDFIGIPAGMVQGGRDVVAAGGDLQTQISSEQALLDAIANESDFDGLVSETVESGLITGHVFIRVVPGVGGAPARLGLLDPSMVTVFWDIEQLGLSKSALWYRLNWEAGGASKQQDIVPAFLTPEGGEGWFIIERMRGKNQLEWVEVGRDRWEYPFPPIVDGKIIRKPHEYYGKSFCADWQVNDTINFVASNTAKIIKHHAHPKTVVQNAEFAGDNAVDELIQINSRPGTQSAVFNLAIDPNGVRFSLDFLQMLRSSYFSMKRVVDPVTVRDKAGSMTNFGLRTLYKNMIDNVMNLRWMFDQVLREALRRAMIVSGGADVKIMFEWDDPLPLDRAELVETVEKEKAMGITSDQTLSAVLGRDYMREREQLKEEGNLRQLSMFDTFEAFGRQGLLT